jgi:hypothetical protein
MFLQFASYILLYFSPFCRHEALRTSYVVGSDGVATRKVVPTLDVLAAPASSSSAPTDTIIIVTDLSKKMKPKAAREFAMQEVDKVAKAQQLLNKCPLFWVRLYRIGKERWIFGVVIHHIITDTTTTRIFFDELLLLYGAFRANQPSPLPTEAVKYSEFAQKQRNAASLMNDHMLYWKQVLEDVPVMNFPVDFVRRPPDEVGTAGPSHWQSIELASSKLERL